jgi:hypothetical protein
MKTKWLLPLGLLASSILLQSNKISSETPPAGALEKISSALPAHAPAKPSKPRRLLVFSATAGFRHASIATGKVALTELGKKTGAFETVISDDLAHFEPDAIQQFDAICFLSTTQDVLSPHPEVLKKMSDEEKKAATERTVRLRKSLMDFIGSGKGFVGIHAATDTLYNMPEYGRMIGGYFNGHPWNAAAEIQIDVEKGMEQHPLAAMFAGQSMNFKEEIYQHKDPYNSSKQQILLRLNVEKSVKVGGMKRSDGDYGVAWARNHGKGRVFYCSLGHNHDMYWNPKILNHYLAGIQWAIGDLQAKVVHD